jgi:GNAT superfamily N-acetyltransferase
MIPWILFTVLTAMTVDAGRRRPDVQIRIREEHDRDGTVHVKAFVDDREIGHASMESAGVAHQVTGQTLYVMESYVHPDFRRMGIATAMYDAVVRHTGKRLIHGDIRGSAEALHLWRKRLHMSDQWMIEQYEEGLLDSYPDMTPEEATVRAREDLFGPRWAYHATVHKNLPSIAKKGLVPGAAPRLRRDDEPAALFLTDDLEFAKGYGGADTVLRFPFPADATPDTHPVSGRAFPHVFRSWGTVPPASLEVLRKDGGWRPLARARRADVVVMELAERSDPRIVPYRDLPGTAQLALAHYMAVDGGAWGMPSAFEAFWGRPDATTALWKETFASNLPWFVQKYGDRPFGYVVLPMDGLREAVMASADLDMFDDFDAYHAWYVGSLGEREAEQMPATADDPWPVILSSGEDDEALQDGWHRFHRYHQLGLEHVPAVFYPPLRRNGENQ